MELKEYFFDTYAFCEIIVGNPAYERFLTGVAIITTKLQLIETYYFLLRNYEEKIANKTYDKLLQYCIEIDDKSIKQAMKFKLKHAKKKLSYVDAIGYMIARNHNAPFLTGDKEFKGMENVEFVK